jgi:uncharacterized membrane protein YhaH (DUF805 family)
VGSCGLANHDFLKGNDMMAQMSNSAASAAMMIATAFAVLFAVAISILALVVYCKITAKAGYPWALGLLMVVPVANLIFLLYFAFAEWPIQRELRQWRQQYGGPRA